MMTTGKKFVILLRRGMGLTMQDDGKELPVIEDEKEWLQIMRLAKEQAVSGILFRGMQQMPSEFSMPRQIVLRSYMRSQEILKYNKKVDDAAVRLCAKIEQSGFPCCVLKGQGNALLYPDPSARMAGDIDVWVAASPKSVVDFARKALPSAHACYHHVTYAKCNGVEVELHYRPAFMNNPFHNRRMQRWFLKEAEAQCKHGVTLPNGAGTINVPTDAFNRIFQMTHMMNHVVHEGLGMRQLMDYYFLLRRGFTPEEKLHDQQLFQQFGLYGMAGAVMYVLRWLFVLPDDLMLVPPDRKRGVFLLKEVLYGGNFGHYDPQTRKARTWGARNMLRIKRDLKMLTIFPSECLCEPLFRMWHFFWRIPFGINERK